MAINIDGLEYGVSAEGMSSLDKQLNQLMAEEITDAIRQTKEQVVTDLQTCWQGVSEKKFEADFDVYVSTINNAIIKEYENLQNRLKDIAYNIYKADEELYTSTGVIQ